MKSLFNRKKTHEEEQELKNLMENTRFTENQIIEMKSRFNKVSKKHNKLNREQFRQHMGLLGIDSALFLSDRIFRMLDINNDESVDFEEFMKYLDILLNGNQNEKNEWTFKLIDTNKRGFFDQENLKSLFDSMMNIWASMTGIQINNEILKNIRIYVKQMFIKMDREHQQKVTLSDFKEAINEDPNMLEIFDVLNKGLTQTTSENQKNLEYDLFKRALTQVKNSLDMMILELQGDQFHMQKYKTSGDSPTHFKVKTQTYFHRDTAGSFQTIEKFKQTITSTYWKEKQIISSQYTSVPNPLYVSPTPLAFNQSEEDFILPDEERVRCLSRKTSLMTKRTKTSGHIQLPNDSVGSSALKIKRSLTPVIKSSDRRNSRSKLLKQFSDEEKINKENQEHSPLNNSLNIIENFQEKTKKIITKLKDINDYIKTTGSSIDAIFQRNTKNNPAKSKPDLDIEDYRVKKEEMVYNKMKTVTAQKIPKKNFFFKGKKEMKNEKGSLVFLGHHNWNLVLNMMIGIQTALKSLFLSTDYKLTEEDFKLSYFFEIMPRKYNKTQDTFSTCRFYDYSPYVFLKIRENNKIKNEDYIKSIGPERMISNLIKGNVNTLSELISTGKSGSFFYYTADGKYTLKTIHKCEQSFFKKILRNYYDHLVSHKSSFINKIYGFHKIKYKVRNELKTKRLYFIIMENILNTEKVIHHRYDLKGSLYKRKTTEDDPSIAKKDQNAIEENFKLLVTSELHSFFIQQLEIDCEFLEKNNIIDYSFLIGIHKRNMRFKFRKNKPCQTEKSNLSSFRLLSNYSDPSTIFNRQILSADGNYIYYLGIIDIFTNFGLKKKCEYGFKSIVFGPDISAIPPQRYSTRFKNFIMSILEIHNPNNNDLTSEND